MASNDDSNLTKIVANVFSKKSTLTWEIWSNGRAFSDSYANAAAYRWPDGTWRLRLVSDKRAPKTDDSDLIEEAFQKYINSIIVGPVDPYRHLRKK